MNLLLVDYITRAIGLLALGSTIYLLITNFEAKSNIMKLLHVMVTCVTVGLLMTISFYFITDEGLIRIIDLIAGLLYDISAAAGGIASLLRLKELLPLFLKFNSNRKAKIFENGIRISIGIIIFCFIRNDVSRFLWYADYTTGWVFALFYAQAGLMFYFACMISDLIGCTWTAIYILDFFSKKKHPLSKSLGLKVSITLLYITGIMSGVVGIVSVNGKIDVLDNITNSASAVYYTLIIRVLVEMRKLCNEAFKAENSSSHGYANQEQKA